MASCVTFEYIRKNPDIRTYIQRHGKEQHDQAAVDAGTAQFCFLQRIHTFSPTFFPRMPAGLTSSITIRIRNTTALASDELM